MHIIQNINQNNNTTRFEIRSRQIPRIAGITLNDPPPPPRPPPPSPPHPLLDLPQQTIITTNNSSVQDGTRTKKLLIFFFFLISILCGVFFYPSNQSNQIKSQKHEKVFFSSLTDFVDYIATKIIGKKGQKHTPSSNSIKHLQSAIYLRKIHESITLQTAFLIKKMEERLKNKINFIFLDNIFQQVLRKKLSKYAADKVELADFASSNLGGKIVETKSIQIFNPPYISVFGLPIYRLYPSPNIVLEPSVNPGDCFAFHGSRGEFLIKLPQKLFVNAISIDHISPSVSPTGNIDSAPKTFHVVGLSFRNDQNKVLLGKFNYSQFGPSVQTFRFEQVTMPMQFIHIAIISNHGHQNYTCVYRIRVHGQLLTNTDN